MLSSRLDWLIHFVYQNRREFCTVHYFVCGFFIPVVIGGFHLKLGDSKSHWISRTHQIILADRSSDVGWMVSILLPISSLPNLIIISIIIIIIITIIIIIPLRVFLTSVSWGSSTRVRVKASLLKSPRLFSVFWPIFIMLWSPLVLLFPNPPVPLLIL